LCSSGPAAQNSKIYVQPNLKFASGQSRKELSSASLNLFDAYCLGGANGQKSEVIMSYFESRAGRAVTCILYLLLGLLTGLFPMLAGSIKGGHGPMPLPWDIGLLGSVLLAIAALTAPFRFRGTGYIALLGGIMILVLYLPLFLGIDRTGRVAAGVDGILVVLVILLVSVIYPVASILASFLGRNKSPN